MTSPTLGGRCSVVGQEISDEPAEEDMGQLLIFEERRFLNFRKSLVGPRRMLLYTYGIVSRLERVHVLYQQLGLCPPQLLTKKDDYTMIGVSETLALTEYKFTRQTRVRPIPAGEMQSVEEL